MRESFPAALSWSEAEDLVCFLRLNKQPHLWAGAGRLHIILTKPHCYLLGKVDFPYLFHVCEWSFCDVCVNEAQVLEVISCLQISVDQ